MRRGPAGGVGTAQAGQVRPGSGRPLRPSINTDASGIQWVSPPVPQGMAALPPIPLLKLPGMR